MALQVHGYVSSLVTIFLCFSVWRRGIVSFNVALAKGSCVQMTAAKLLGRREWDCCDFLLLVFPLTQDKYNDLAVTKDQARKPTPKTKAEPKAKPARKKASAQRAHDGCWRHAYMGRSAGDEREPLRKRSANCRVHGNGKQYVDDREGIHFNHESKGWRLIVLGLPGNLQFMFPWFGSNPCGSSMCMDDYTVQGPQQWRGQGGRPG
eukprot:1162054-Pelagomonas_calceolata.AAC.8